jgi:hypothetical protein
MFEFTDPLVVFEGEGIIIGSNSCDYGEGYNNKCMYGCGGDNNCMYGSSEFPII